MRTAKRTQKISVEDRAERTTPNQKGEWGIPIKSSNRPSKKKKKRCESRRKEDEGRSQKRKPSH